jgi:hypothetical protein
MCDCLEADYVQLSSTFLTSLSLDSPDNIARALHTFECLWLRGRLTAGNQIASTLSNFFGKLVALREVRTSTSLSALNMSLIDKFFVSDPWGLPRSSTTSTSRSAFASSPNRCPLDMCYASVPSLRTFSRPKNGNRWTGCSNYDRQIG